MAATNHDISHSNRASRIVYTATTSGTYTIQVSGHDSNIGTYELSVNVWEPTPIEVGQILSGSITTSGEQDRFTVSLQAGTTYRIETTLHSLNDSVMRLFNPSGSKVEEDDDGGAGRASRIDYTATTSGAYTIQVEGYGSNTGSYELSVQTLGYAVTPIQMGQTVSGNLEQGERYDFYEVSLQAGKDYRIETVLDTLDDSELVLIDPNGSVAASDDDGGPGSASRIVYTATTSGTYTIRVEGDGSSDTGSYQLWVRLPPQASCGRRGDGGNTTICDILVNSTMSGNVTSPGRRQLYRAQLQAGTRYRIKIEGVYDLKMRLFIGDLFDNQEITNGWEWGNSIVFDHTATHSGRHTIMVRFADDELVDIYEISLETR